MPRGGKPPAFGTDPSKGLPAGEGARAPFACPQEWSTKRVLMSGFGLGFLQSWCCQFKLQYAHSASHDDFHINVKALALELNV